MTSQPWLFYKKFNFEMILLTVFKNKSEIGQLNSPIFIIRALDGCSCSIK